MKRSLHKFSHGLGDAVLLTSIIRHLRHYRPNEHLSVAALRGKHSLFHGLADEVFVRDDKVYKQHQFDEILDYEWHECEHSYPDFPSTKTTKCLREFLHLEPIPELLSYKVSIGQDALSRATEYAKPLGKFVCFHYEGNTSPGNKNLTENEAKQFCGFLQGLGYTPVILDWDRRSRLPDGKTIFCPDAQNSLWKGYGTGDGETLAALMSLSSLNVCVDSGPQKVAMTLGVPLICIWVRHHPIHYCDLTGAKVWHLVPADHETLVRGNKADGLAYFNANYRHLVYKDRIGDTMGLATNLLNPVQSAPRAVDGFVDGFAVGIPTLSRYDLLDKCLDSVFASSVTPARVLVIDNGGSYKPKTDRVEVIRPGQNLGVSVSWNILHNLAAPLEVVLLNDDIILGHNTLERLMASDAHCAKAQGFSCVRNLQWVWRKLGGYDETFFPGYFEDNCFSYRVKLAGLREVDVVCDSCHHTGSATINSFGPAERGRFQENWERSRAYYIRKWGGMPHRETYNKPFNAGKEVNLLDDEFRKRCHTGSDINEHLVTLHAFGKSCKHITEFGAGHGNSTVAFLHAQPDKFVTVDINLLPEIEDLHRIAGRTEFVTIHNDDREIEIEETDLLFIDTLHTYGQLQKELELHGNKAIKFLIFHDTVTFGQHGEHGQEGLSRAIAEFLSENPHWHFLRSWDGCNGLLVLRRV